MKRCFKKLLLAATTVFLLAACSNGAKPSSPEKVPEVKDPESILKDLDFKPIDPINYDDKAYYYSDHINKVDPEFELLLTANPELENSEKVAIISTINENGLEDDIIIQNNFDCESIDLDYTYTPGETECKIIPGNGLYRKGLIYTAELANQNLCFKGKSPTIRKLYFDIEREDTFVYKLSKDLKYFDASKVLKEADLDTTDIADPNSEEAKQWFENTTYELIYATDEFKSLKEGDNFAICPFKAGKPAMDQKNSYYGKFVKNEKVSNGYKVTYKNVDLHEIYKDKNGNEALDIYLNEQKAKEFRDVALRFDKEQFKKDLINDRSINRLVDASLIATKNPTNATKYDILTAITINPTFSWDAPKFVFQLEAGVNIPINEAKTSALQITITYQYISTLSTGASYKLKKFLGIPYWLIVQGDVTQEVEQRVGFSIALMRNFTPDEKDTSDMKQMVKEAYNKLENDPAYFMVKDDDEYSTTANDRLIPIAALNIPFGGIFSFFVEFDIHLTMDFRILFEYNYYKTYTERVLSYSSDDGVENTSNTESVSVSAHQIDLLGQLSFQIGLQIRVGLCITGLEKIFGFGLIFEGGVYVDLKGMVGITWGDNQQTQFVGGVNLDIGLYGVISAYADILCCHPKYDFAKGKLPFFEYTRPFSIIDLMGPDSIDINEKITYLETTNILMTKVFSVEEMKIAVKGFAANDTVETKIPGADEPQQTKPLIIEDDSPYLEIDEANNNIVVSENCPAAFTAHITITANDEFTYLLDDEPLSKVVTVNYHSKDAHKVSIKGASNTIEVEKGKTIHLPHLVSFQGKGDKMESSLEYDDTFGIKEGEFVYDATYYDFVCFTDGTNNYNPGDTITVGDNDIVLTPVVKVIIYYTATFYNGKGQVISTSRVREKTDAVAPSEQQIMQGMEGYTFYGWDRTFTYLTEDIDVYGIYYKVEA